ncbi:MAG: energy-coupling factor transporter ATP-binding protein EcfA2 [Chlamydiales bacterium]
MNDVSRSLENLRDDLNRDLSRVSDLHAVQAERHAIDELFTDLEHQLTRVRRAAVITLVGATGAGKSTLLNALVGQRIAREGNARPTTSVPVVYRPRDADLRELLERLPGGAPDVVDYDPDGGGPWSEQILIDAPDINSVAAEHRDVVAALAARSDVLVVVTHRQSVSELSSVSFVEHFAGRRGLLVVLNRADELTEDAQSELLGMLRELARERWASPDAVVLATSARAAQSQPQTPGWEELCDQLRALVLDGVIGRVRRHNAIGTTAHLAHCFAAIQNTTRTDFETLESSLRAGIGEWGQRVDREAATRLALRAAQLRAMLWNETARRWDGPGGWALRAGGLAALGLSAGVALARRHPLVAAGAAAGAVAADKARDAWRERQFQDTAGLLPGSTELEAWYRQDLSEARLRAIALAGTSGEADGRAGNPPWVPTGRALAERADQALSEAWQQLLERDLLRAAERSAPWALRMLVDLPVYGFAGWIVWRALIGFQEGAYVGIDFLVNAVLILMAWLFVGRTVVRLALRGRSATLLSEVRAGASESLGRTLDQALDEAHEQITKKRAALEQLCGVEDQWRSEILGTDSAPSSS